MFTRFSFAIGVTLAGIAAMPAFSAEFVVLSEDNWDEYAPAGKETDAIYGDYVLRNGEIVAVIAKAVEGRNANMTTRYTGGCLIDLTRRDHQSDQLSALYPGGVRSYALEFEGVIVGDSGRPTMPTRDRMTAETLTVVMRGEGRMDRPALEVRYTLSNTSPYLIVETTYTNESDETAELEPRDTMRADLSRDGRAPERHPEGETGLLWFYDKWFGQAYGLMALGATIDVSYGRGGRGPVNISYLYGGDETVRILPDESWTLERRMFPGKNMFDVQAIAATSSDVPTSRVTISVRTPANDAVPNADLAVEQNGSRYAWGRTNKEGNLTFLAPHGAYSASARALGYGSASFSVDAPGQRSYTATLEAPGFVRARVTDRRGGPIPAKVQFFGRYGQDDPDFGPDSGINGIHNVYYTHDGAFQQALPPGDYGVIVSHGPEYDAVFTEITVQRGEVAPVNATLLRTVQTPGWVSSDFHSHSSPSGDNTSSQRGRVLNLLAEHIEFAPCTEHNRVDTYVPHLEALGVAHLMATCSGMELTSSPGSLNHHNAFPLMYRPHMQDGGGPQTSMDPEVQIERLALWDDRSEKLVQQNHPDIPRLFYDRNDDGREDGGYDQAVGYMDVIEVHPPMALFDAPYQTLAGDSSETPRRPTNRIFSWMQSLNQGIWAPGVVNTDAHANYHGSGWLRNYLKSSTDDPAEVDTMEMVHSAERGNVVMSNGPYLEASVRTGVGSADPGDKIGAPSGEVTVHVRVQCPNWLDVDRVQLFVNGRALDEYNFTRKSHPRYFGDGVVKFDREISVILDEDAHIIAGTIGEHLQLGPIYGQRHGDDRPVAVANPIFVDVNGGGFTPNGDTLDAPLVAPRES